MRGKILLILAATIATPSSLLAQQEGEQGEQRTTPSQVERIEVTGSYIKRVDVEGAQPVQTLDRDYLDRTGYNSVSDVLRELSANSFGSLREESGTNAADMAGISLRGMGENRTLVLINGRRMAKDGIVGSVDLNLIPMAAVERIDVLKDSSSALYGSDAIGGVINVIMKKNYNGMEAQLRQTVNEYKGGNRSTVSGLYGWSNEKMNITTALQYRSNSEIYDRDRPWSDYAESVYAPNPNIFLGGAPTPQTGHTGSCGENAVRGSDNLCYFNYTTYSTGLPELKQISLFSNARLEINADTEIYAQLMATHKDTNYVYAPGAVRLGRQQSDGSTTDLTVSGVGSLNGYWRSLALGTRDTELDVNSIGVSTGARRYLGETWEIDLAVGTQRVQRDSESPNGYARSEELFALIEQGSTGSCDLFTSGASCSIPDSIRYTPWEKTKSRLDYIELRTNGELFDLPAGPLSMAIGSQHTYETYSDRFDDLSTAGGVSGGNAGSNGEGSRHVTAAFTEFALPLLSGLDIQLAGRYDKYSDFGDTFNPKISLMYKPLSSLLLRASAGTGFKAPDMVDLYASSSAGFPLFIDQVACANGSGTNECSAKQHKVISGGNSNLQEEESKNFTIGAVIQPIDSLSFSLDYFNIKMENIVGLSYKGLMLTELNGGNLAAYNTEVHRKGDGTIDYIKTQLQNLSERKVQGLDFSLTYNTHFKTFGAFMVRTEASYMLKYEQQLFPGLGYTSLLTEAGAPRWRNNLTIAIAPLQDFALSTNLVTTGKVHKSSSTGKLDPYTRIDLNGSYSLRSLNADIQVSLRNILGTTPPLDDTVSGDQLDGTLYDGLGRRLIISYTQRF